MSQACARCQRRMGEDKIGYVIFYWGGVGDVCYGCMQELKLAAMTMISMDKAVNGDV